MCEIEGGRSGELHGAGASDLDYLYTSRSRKLFSCFLFYSAYLVEFSTLIMAAAYAGYGQPVCLICMHSQKFLCKI